MNRILLALLTIGFAFYGQAQTIILEEDFQGFANGGEINFIEVPDDAESEDWLSVDLDNLPDANARPQNWYGSTDFLYTIEDAPDDTNFVMASSSWLDGFAPGNRNYLITPEIDVQEGYRLVWSAGVFQTPRYADGYSVLVSPEADMDDLEANFSDELFRQSQMVEETGWLSDYYGSIDYTGCNAAGEFDVPSFCWFPEDLGDGTGGFGYTHADQMTDECYLLENGTSWVGLLEPHSVDLSAYAGMTIRIAWVHNSDDDNLLMVDDISVVDGCTANAGTLTAVADTVDLVSGSAMLEATVNCDKLDPVGYSTTYVLTSGDDLVIEQVNSTPDFTVDAMGDYTIHTLVSNEDLDLSVIVFGETTGVDVLNIIADNDICASLDAVGAPVHVRMPISVNEFEAVEFQMFPNPANGELFINSVEQIESIAIYDTQGRLVISQANNIQRLDISSLSEGIYEVAVSVGTRVSTKRLVKLSSK